MHCFGKAEPNRRLSKKLELRFGTNGSKSVDLEKGVYFDHESNEGGDAIDLIMRQLGIGDRRVQRAALDGLGHAFASGTSETVAAMAPLLARGTHEIHVHLMGV